MNAPDSIHFSENIIRLRRQKKITQEELASFIGVTKASVSKWETGQSLPDILLLPQLASFFDVTLDDLIGFKPQLSREQIQKIYQELAADFAKHPFQQAMDKSRPLAKKYYACYPFLLQIAVLWINHFMLAPDPAKQQEVLNEAAALCSHIISDCKDIGICNDALVLKASTHLAAGKPLEVIDTLEELLNPTRLANQSDGFLIQAYLLSGAREKAVSYAQISMYTHLLCLMGSALQYLSITSDDLPACEETIRRMSAMLEAFDLEHLHPNTASSFYYQAASIYCSHGQEAQALSYLAKYAENIRYLLADENISLHGDDYFYHLDEWTSKLDLGSAPPRDRKVVAESAVQLLDHPVFSSLRENATFKQIKTTLMKEVERQ